MRLDDLYLWYLADPGAPRTMTLAERAGITVAKTKVIPLVGSNAVAVRRFDRERDRRIHSISAGTAIRAATLPGAEPEMGYPELARILRRVGVAQDDTNLPARDAGRSRRRGRRFCSVLQ